MRKIFTKTGSRGDTIIEILLSIAVLSLVLSVSYGLANRSSQATRQAQERSEAQKLAEEQLELLRGYFSPDHPWEDRCFNQAGAPTTTDADCHRGPDGRYNIENIEQIGNTFTVHMNWPSARGGTDELTLAYKLPVTEDIFATPHYQCDDDEDNGPIQDGVKDQNDPDCWTTPGNPASYDNTIDEEDPVIPPPVALTVQKSPSAGGTVTGSGINCGSTCVRNNIPNGENIVLNANPATNYTFNGWTPSDCNNFSITSNKTCRANFTYNPPPPRKPLHRCYLGYNWAGNPLIYTNHFYYASEPGTVGCYPGVNYPPIPTYYDGIMGYAPYSSNSGAQPVYGGWNVGAYDAFYTMNYAEYVSAHYGGWNYTSGVQYWAYPYPCTVAGTIPVYRWWSGYVGNHFYTTNASENPNNFWSVDGGGTYVYEGIMGCVFSSP